MIRYRCIEGVYYLPEIGQYKSFGLAVLDEVGEVLQILSDVSPNEHLVVSIAELFTQEQLEPVHLMDVLEDIL